MLKLTVYKCDTCGKVFTDYDECYKHELKCDRCKHCKNAYYVYGCEFACKYEGKCRFPDWTYFEEEKK